jgi:hypothetical protein
VIFLIDLYLDEFSERLVVRLLGWLISQGNTEVHRNHEVNSNPLPHAAVLQELSLVKHRPRTCNGFNMLRI